MNIMDVIKKGGFFRRSAWKDSKVFQIKSGEFVCKDDPNPYKLSAFEVQATDWEVAANVLEVSHDDLARGIEKFGAKDVESLWKWLGNHES